MQQREERLEKADSADESGHPRFSHQDEQSGEHVNVDGAQEAPQTRQSSMDGCGCAVDRSIGQRNLPASTTQPASPLAFATKQITASSPTTVEDANGPASDDEDPCCRICRQGEEVGKLYCPCRCAGSIKWIHESCLRTWLKSQNRGKHCELCGYAFGFLPVYARHAPHRLTAEDWQGVLKALALVAVQCFLRIAYATVLWGIALPLSTVCVANALLGGRKWLPTFGAHRVLPFMLNVFLGECLSLVGITILYWASVYVLRNSLDTAESTNSVDPVQAQVSSAEGANTLDVSNDRVHMHVPRHPANDAPQSMLRMPQRWQPPQQPQQPQHALTSLTAPIAESVNQATLSSAEPDALSSEELRNLDEEEDLWIILGLKGNPLRALLCVVILFCANIAGVTILLALPFFLGRTVLGISLPFALAHIRRRDASISDALKWLVSLVGSHLDFQGSVSAESGSAGGSWPAEHLALLFTEGASFNATVVDGSAALELSLQELPAPGVSPLLDAGAIAVGYATVVIILMIVIPASLVLGAAFGRPEVLRSTAEAVRSQVCQLAAEIVSKLQTIVVVFLPQILVPCYIGHLVICFLCGPVLHIPQHVRASKADASLPLVLVMQLCVGYVHLWGVAFLESCLAEVLEPTIFRNASANFFLGAVSSHRYLFGNISAPATGGSSGITWSLCVSQRTALKLALVLVAVHTPLVYLLWRLPAQLLDCMLGEALFPIHLVDHASGVWAAALAVARENSAPRLNSTEATPPGSVAEGAGLASAVTTQTIATTAANPTWESQTLFALEMLHLYILVLQCLQVLGASPGLIRFVSGWLRGALRRVGLQHLLAAPWVAPGSLASRSSAIPSQQPGAAEGASIPTPPPSVVPHPASSALVRPRYLWLSIWPLLYVLSLLVALTWTVVIMMLSLPLVVGRALVRYVLAVQTKRVSDVLPLSMGVVAFALLVFAAVTLGEALPTIVDRASAFERNRRLRLVACALSSTAMASMGFVLIPLGLGTLLLRLVQPLKAYSVFQEPIILLFTDCWSLGFLSTKVIWCMVQTDMAWHGLHLEFSAVWAEVQGSFINLFFDLRAHGRIWRSLFWPLIEVITVHLMFPRAVAFTLIMCIPENQEYLRAALLMYCYHIILGFRLWPIVMPLVRRWCKDAQQHMFDTKYLVATELQNYHPVEAPASSARQSTTEAGG